MSDPINPAHYRNANIECIDAIRAALGDDAFVAYCRGNVMKYTWRTKDAPAQDAGKAQWYAQMAAHVLDPAKYADPRAIPATPPVPVAAESGNTVAEGEGIDTSGWWRVMDKRGDAIELVDEEFRMMTPYRTVGRYEAAYRTYLHWATGNPTFAPYRIERVV